MNPMHFQDIRQTRILIRGAGDLATGVAHRLFKSGFQICLLETGAPMAVRRSVSFCEAVHKGSHCVDGVKAELIHSPDLVKEIWKQKNIPILVDPENKIKDQAHFHVVVDAILAKKNLGTTRRDAPLVIGLGPGFTAGDDVHLVVETKRGHNLGRVIGLGCAQANTGIPGTIGGYNVERVFRAPCSGIFTQLKEIGEFVAEGEPVAQVDSVLIHSRISGIVRGILKSGTPVTRGVKSGDVDPRGTIKNCFSISDKARSLGGAVLECILSGLPERIAAHKPPFIQSVPVSDRLKSTAAHGLRQQEH